MSAVMNTIGVAFAYAVLALFAQNAIFTRGLGGSRLIQLVGDERTSSWWFALLTVNSISGWMDRTESRLYQLMHRPAAGKEGAE